MYSLEQDVANLENAIRLFVQTMKRPQRWAAIQALAGTDFDRSAAMILHILAQSGRNGCRVQSLATQLAIEPPFVTRKTQELERAGYLRRVPDTRDRRAIDLRITPRGRRLAGRLHEAQRSVLMDTLQDWKPEDRRQFIELFQRFSNQLATAAGTEDRRRLKRKDMYARHHTNN
jgi:DNA-binding MarR family transcriptional regulator